MNATATIARGRQSLGPQALARQEHDSQQRGPQHMQALARANEVRLARAELKRRVMDGETTAADVILASPWEAATMAVSELLMSQHRWGHQRARRFLATVPMTETKTIGSMTLRQRRSLAEMLASQSRTVRTGAQQSA